MRKALLVLSIGSILAVSTSMAQAGCLGGAAVGGVGGHFVGHGHALLGAAAGCAVGHHMAVKKDEQQRQAQANQQRAYQQGRSGQNYTR